MFRSKEKKSNTATSKSQARDRMTASRAVAATNAPNAPTRYMSEGDKALMNIATWSKVSKITDFKLEDQVSLADSKAAFLQGIVAYVGEVTFAEGYWVGVQLTGPSLGKGHNNGSVKGVRYFPDVGHKNGIFAPLHQVQKRIKTKSGDPHKDAMQKQRRTHRSQMADAHFVETLKEERAAAILKDAERKGRRNVFYKEEVYIQQLKQQRLEELRRARNEPPPRFQAPLPPAAKLRYGKSNHALSTHDYTLVQSLEQTQQNFCLSDPSLPNNPITYASQAFLNMTLYQNNDILGRNCRFLQGPGTDPHHIHRIRTAIRQGSDCSVCLLNYRADGSAFWNQCFITALRDVKGRIKNYLGVQCEVSPDVAARMNRMELGTSAAAHLQAKQVSTLKLQLVSKFEQDMLHNNSDGVSSAGGTPSVALESSNAFVRDYTDPTIAYSSGSTLGGGLLGDMSSGMIHSNRSSLRDDDDTMQGRRSSQQQQHRSSLRDVDDSDNMGQRSSLRDVDFDQGNRSTLRDVDYDADSDSGRRSSLSDRISNYRNDFAGNQRRSLRDIAADFVDDGDFVDAYPPSSMAHGSATSSLGNSQARGASTVIQNIDDFDLAVLASKATFFQETGSRENFFQPEKPPSMFFKQNKTFNEPVPSPAPTTSTVTSPDSPYTRPKTAKLSNNNMTDLFGRVQVQEQKKENKKSSKKESKKEKKAKRRASKGRDALVEDFGFAQF